MKSISRVSRIPRLLAVFLLAANVQAEEEKVLNVYSWPDYISEDTIKNFKERTGIQVNYDVYGSNEMLEAKLLAGNSGYDVVMPSAFFFERQIKIGLFQKLDTASLSGLDSLDTGIMARLARVDPNNEHGVPYMWGTTGVGYNAAMVAAVLPDAPVDSWDMLFDPEVVARLSECGVTLLDAPSEVFAVALAYLGKDPNSEDMDDLKAAEELLAKIRPYVRYIQSQQYYTDLANGEICLALSWSGDVMLANERAAEAGNGVELSYSIPREGAIMWMDVMAIPSDAPHPVNAHRFIDYMLEPEVIAGSTSYNWFANANTAAIEFIDEKIANNPSVYPSEEVKARLYSVQLHAARYTRAQTRAWTRFKTGR